MSLSAGQRLGSYEILGFLGAGGMGQVYRARDAKLGRDVAIKVLPPEVATDPDRLARFHREAQVLAALNHPGIAAIHGIEDSSSVHALVMELVEGDTLADRIARGPIAVDEALPIARQIADALEAAHEQGIVHRDLKPANIKVRDDGTVKVLDFGLAKLADGSAHASGHDISLSPTVASPALMTGVGTILGTAAYMSPEQARGRKVDARADVWAFGCVFYEMLTGRRAFDGEDVTAMLAAIIRSEPEWSALPASLSPTVRVFLHRCLEKDPKRRVRGIHDVRLALDGAFDLPVPAAPPLRPSRLPWLVATAALLVGVAGVTTAWRSGSSPDAAEMRLQIALPPTAELASFALSPDGRTLAFIMDRKLWLRALAAETPVLLKDVDDIAAGSAPFWSPDGRSLAFFAIGKLRRIDLPSGVMRTITDLPSDTGLGGTWNADDTIVFAPSGDGRPLYRVAANGGDATAVTRLDADHRTHRFPQFLPGGKRFIFFARTTTGQGLYLGSLDSTDTRRILDSDGSAVFVRPDFVVFGRKGALLAQRLDLATMTPRGNPVSVSGQVVVDWRPYNSSVAGNLAVSASTTGTLAYRPDAGRRRPVWLDDRGQQVGVMGNEVEMAGGIPFAPRQTRDGRAIAYATTSGGNTDVWLIAEGRPPRRFTADAFSNLGPVWSPDGTEIVFASNRKGVLDLYRKPIGGGDERPLLESTHGKGPNDWSPDGRYILYQDADPKTSDDIWALPLFGDGKPFVVARTPFLECCARFSPDGHWVAYWSRETGRAEVYVQAFPSGANRTRVSTAGGTAPDWRADGRRLFYVQGRRMMSVPLTNDGVTLKAGTPVALFDWGGAEGLLPSWDGDRFLAAIDEPASPITILLNWKPSE